MFDVIAAVCFTAAGYGLAGLEPVFVSGDWSKTYLAKAAVGVVLGVAGAVLLFA